VAQDRRFRGQGGGVTARFARARRRPAGSVAFPGLTCAPEPGVGPRCPPGPRDCPERGRPGATCGSHLRLVHLVRGE
jgi:hypothetical protein